MKTSSLNLAVAAVVLAGVSQVAQADLIPYPGSGAPNVALYNFTAASTGPITAYYGDQSFAGYDNDLGLNINGVSTGIFGLNNHSYVAGGSLVLGNATIGDQLTFVLRINSLGGQLVYSDPALNVGYDGGVAPGNQHVYSTPYTATAPIFPGVPAGTYVSFEDLSVQGGSDYNYNDENFVFANVAVPEPSTYLAGALLALPFGLNGLRSLRSRKQKA